MEGNISVKDTSVNLQETFLDLYKQQKLRKYQKCQSNLDLHHNTVGISQYNTIQSAKYCNLIGWLRATELDYIVKCLQYKLLLVILSKSKKVKKGIKVPKTRLILCLHQHVNVNFFTFLLIYSCE